MTAILGGSVGYVYARLTSDHIVGLILPGLATFFVGIDHEISFLPFCWLEKGSC